MVNRKRIYLLYANRQGGFEVLRRCVGERSTQSIFQGPDERSIWHWLNSRPALFMETSEWRVVTDHADPIASNITIPALGSMDARRFLQQRLRSFEPQAPWRQLTPILPNLPASPAKSSRWRQVQQNLHGLFHRHWHFPRRWVVHALPNGTPSNALQQLIANIAQRPKTHVTGPFSIAQLLAHAVDSPQNSALRFRVCPARPQEASKGETLVSLQAGETVLFSRVITHSQYTPKEHLARLLPTLYAHHLLERHSDLPTIESIDPGIYPDGLLRWLAEQDSLRSSGLAAFCPRDPADKITIGAAVKRAITCKLQQRPIQICLLAGTLVSVSLLTGAALRDAESVPPPNAVRSAASPLDHPVSSNSATPPEPADVADPAEPTDTAPKIDLNILLPPATTTRTSGSYGWIRRSDGMVLRWNEETSRPAETPPLAPLSAPAPTTPRWTLRRAQP